MASRRRYQWIDAIVSSETALVGAAAPGTIIEDAIVLESELENIGGGATLMRVVGDIWIRRTAGTAPIVSHTLFVAQQFVGIVQPTDWVGDTFQNKMVLGTWLSMVGSTDGLTVHHRVDLRTKRKLGQGVAVLLASQNHSIATNDTAYVFHLRCLLLLP